MTSAARTLRGGDANAGGYRQLVPGPGETHLVREELHAAVCDQQPIATIAHLSDLHVCDAQSPARVEFLDRWADPDSPIRELLGEMGVYRAQELLTARVVDAMTRSVNAVESGPIGGRAPELAIATGDNTDNAQRNELDWYLALLDGGPVRPDSGDLSRWEGVGDVNVADERYWHPDATVDDLPRRRYGFPAAPGLLDAARAPFDAAGLALPWLAVHGNHDRLMQGTAPGEGIFGSAAVGARKPTGLPDGLSPDELLVLLGGLADCDASALATLAGAPSRVVTADSGRRIVSCAEFVAAHATGAERPPRHGFPANGRPYYRHDLDGLTLLVLDTVNPFGGWQGSLDRAQFEWLRAELGDADAQERLVALASHHPLDTLINPIAPDRAHRRVLRDELHDELAMHRSLVLWLNGHTHQAAILGRETWWEVTAPSLIDWPQQGRLVEVLRGGGALTIATTMLDHAGEAPWSGSIEGVRALAGLSRELAANHWQHRDEPFEAQYGVGEAKDRNALLSLADPFA